MTASARFTLSILLPPLVVAVVLAGWIDIFRIQGRSMEPLLADGERVFVNRLAYGFRLPILNRYIVQWDTPAAGDLVVYTSPLTGELVVKRCWASSGQRFSLQGDTLRAHGVSAPVSSYVQERLAGLERVPGDRVLFIGDHRLASRDSRHYGFVSIHRVHGTIIGVE
jgi:signal peptidase I